MHEDVIAKACHWRCEILDELEKAQIKEVDAMPIKASIHALTDMLGLYMRLAYLCLDFVRDVWLEKTNPDVGSVFPHRFDGTPITGEEFRVLREIHYTEILRRRSELLKEINSVYCTLHIPQDNPVQNSSN